MLNQNTPAMSGYVYLIGSTRFGWFKIGKAKRADVRIEQLGILLPFKVEIHGLWTSPNHSAMELAMHEKYSDSHINGEWFSFDMEGLKEVIADEQPCRSIRIFPPEGISSTMKVSSCNVKDDIVKNKWFEKDEAERMAAEKIAEEESRLKERAAYKKEIAKKGIAFGEAMKLYHVERGLVKTKETQDAARKWVMENYIGPTLDGRKRMPQN